MTDKEELFLLQAIEKMNSTLPQYKKVYVRYPMEPYDPVPKSFEEVSTELFPYENLKICNDLSIQEWDKIGYDLETRTPYFFAKYTYK